MAVFRGHRLHGVRVLVIDHELRILDIIHRQLTFRVRRHGKENVVFKAGALGMAGALDEPGIVGELTGGRVDQPVG